MSFSTFEPSAAEYFLNKSEMERTIEEFSRFTDEDYERLLTEFVRVRFSSVNGKCITRKEIAKRLNVGLFVTDALAESHDQRIQRALDRLTARTSLFKDVVLAGSGIVSVEDVIESCTQLTTDLIAHLRSHYSDILKIPPYVFEHLVAEFFARWQYADVRTVGRDPSTGADIHALLRESKAGIEQRIFIEVKRIVAPVEIDVIRALHGAISLERVKYGWNLGMLVTTSQFREYRIMKDVAFEHFGVFLKSEADLRHWLNDYIPHPSGLHLPNPKLKMS